MRAELACEAIQRGCCLELYHGGWTRTVEVHAVGYARNQELVMRVWQTRASRNAMEAAGWKLLRLEDIDRADICGTLSEAPRIGYNRDDEAMARIICRV
jgi:hypothetical protein